MYPRYFVPKNTQSFTSAVHFDVTFLPPPSCHLPSFLFRALFFSFLSFSSFFFFFALHLANFSEKIPHVKSTSPPNPKLQHHLHQPYSRMKTWGLFTVHCPVVVVLYRQTYSYLRMLRFEGKWQKFCNNLAEILFYS